MNISEQNTIVLELTFNRLFRLGMRFITGQCFLIVTKSYIAIQEGKSYDLSYIEEALTLNDSIVVSVHKW